MNWIMFAILGLIAAVFIGGMVAAGRLAFSRQSLRHGKILDHLSSDSRGFTKLLAVPLVAWTLLFLLILVVLLIISAVCLMYAFALIHGEWFALLDSLPKTAGNIVVHLIYPLQVVLLSMITFFLAVGGFQLVLGPVEALSRFRLRIDDITEFARKLSALIALVAGMEVLKILCYSLLVAPSELSSFFARDALPKADPVGAALLAAALLVAVAAWLRKEKGNDE